jgi:pSer/pThr/pTyr-binding forkhead associated (FHA) protein
LQPSSPASTEQIPAVFTTEIGAVDAQPPKATLRIVLPTGDAFDRELSQPETRLGKGPRNDIVIADPAVSTSHAIIISSAEDYTISDVGSRNGTFVGGERITAPRRLAHGDTVSIGRSRIMFRIAGSTDTETIEADLLSLQPKPVPLTQESLAAAAVDEGLIATEQLARLREGAGSRPVYRVLVEDAKLDQPLVRDLMTRVFGIPAATFSAEGPPEAQLAEFTATLALGLKVVPISKSDRGWTVAVADPTDTAATEKIGRQLRSPVELRLATANEIDQQLAHLYGPKLVGVLPSGERLEFALKQREVKIGKAPHNDIVLSDQTVSNSHAIILSHDNVFEIVDLESRNGTIVNGERLVTESRPLRHGDNIQVGRTLLVFRSSTHTSGNTTATLAPEVLAELRRQARFDSEELEAPPTPPAAVPGPGEPASAAVSEQPSTEPEQAQPEEKKKKKKKKKDERLRAAWIGALSRILAQVLGPLALLGISIYVLRQGMTPGTTGNINNKTDRAAKMAKAIGTTRIQGGQFEASGVIQIPGSDGELLFVDDGNSASVLWMKVDQSGQQVGVTQSISLGANVEDPESIAYGGGYFYVLGSQASPGPSDRPALVRFRLDKTHLALQEPAEAMPEVLNFIMSKTPELGSGQQINIEGLAWDPVGERLFVGLRSPLEGGKALIVTLKLLDPGGPFTIANFAEPQTIKLFLDGLGIRDIQYDTKLKGFLIISGATEHRQKMDFRLWEWSGDPASNPEILDVELDPDMKPEGVAHVKSGAREFVFIIGDSSRYAKIDYMDPAQ